MAIDGHQQSHRELGDGECVLAGHIADEDAEFGSAVAVDGVGARPGAHDETEPVGSIEGGGGDDGRSDDKHLVVADGVGESVGVEVGETGDLVAGGFELFDCCVRQRVRE